MSLTLDDFLRLRQTLPVVDVRSEGEYAAGHVRGSFNIPILNNDERKAVGTDYKQKGQSHAIETGYRLVTPRLPEIIEQTRTIAAGHEIIVHCWRGGMRSNKFCEFAGNAGIAASALKGGYKRYRQAALESFQGKFQFVIIGGHTGSGKSEVLRGLRQAGEQVIDLEKLASHKGSVFGGLMMPPQPTTEQFQNELFEEILTLDTRNRIWIEDESIAVGKIFLPEDFWLTMCASPVIELNVEKTVRIERLVSEYGAADPEKFLEAMTKITRKLGGQHFQAAREKVLRGDMHAVIDILLTYYDKAYMIGLNKKLDKVKGRVGWNGNDARTVVNELRAVRFPG